MVDEHARQSLAGADVDALIRCARAVVEMVEDTALTRLRLAYGPLTLDMERVPVGTGQSTTDPEPAAADVPPAPVDPVSAVRVTAPLVGVFYRRPSPGEPPFVEVGQRVEAGQQVAIIEAMKTLNPITVERAGVIGTIHVEDTDVVEFDQLLMTLEPA